VKALYNTKRVAIVRKVRITDAKLSIGVLAPNISKRVSKAWNGSKYDSISNAGSQKSLEV